MIIRIDRPLENDHPDGPASCKWSSGRTGLKQMIIRMDRPWSLFVIVGHCLSFVVCRCLSFVVCRCMSFVLVYCFLFVFCYCLSFCCLLLFALCPLWLIVIFVHDICRLLLFVVSCCLSLVFVCCCLSLVFVCHLSLFKVCRLLMFVHDNGNCWYLVVLVQ